MHVSVSDHVQLLIGMQVEFFLLKAFITFLWIYMLAGKINVVAEIWYCILIERIFGHHRILYIDLQNWL
jgi:hypothetical protein